MDEPKVVITSVSAADFYRRNFPTFLKPRPSRNSIDAPCAYKEEDVWSLAPHWIDSAFVAPTHGALHVITRSAEQRGKARNVCAHVWSGPLPEGSLTEYDARVLIASPGFTFLQMATELDLYELIAYGDHLCGYYTLNADCPDGYRERKMPLISRAELQAYVDNAEGMRGYRQAIKALPFVLDGSPNPAYTMLHMFSCLSFYRGGYCIPEPSMMHKVPLSRRGALVAGEKTLMVNMCWPEYNVCFEVVDQVRDDDGQRQVDPEHARIFALEASGYTVFEIDDALMLSINEFEKMILQVAGIMGKRVPPGKRGPKRQRLLMRETLYTWHRNNGHVDKADR